MIRLFLIVILSLKLSGSAYASAPTNREIKPAPIFNQSLSVVDESVELRCHENPSTCTLDITLEVRNDHDQAQPLSVNGGELLESGKTKIIEVQRVINPRDLSRGPGWGWGSYWRHIVFWRGAKETFKISYEMTNKGRFVIFAPSTWSIEGATSTKLVRVEDGMTVREVILSPRRNVHVVLERSRGQIWRQGGPALAVGFASIDQSEAIQHSGRIAYEIAYPGWVLATLAVETDFNDFVQVVPSIELISPLGIMMTGFNAGIGVPLTARFDGLDAGVRFQAGANLLPLSFLVTHDRFVRHPSVTSTFAQISL